MRLTAGILALCGAALLCLPGVPGLSVIAGGSSVRFSILFDLGDGTYVWADETVADAQTTNATWNAVQHAASSNGIALSSGWTQFGVGIFDMGDRHPPAGYVGLLQWNTSSRAWELAPVGISSLVVGNGDVIALYDPAFTTTPPYSVRTPVPTPEDRWPATEFRGDLSNSGLARSSASNPIRVLWDRDTGKKEIGSTPAVAFGKVFVTTLGGLFALNAATGAPVWNNSNARGFSSPAVYNGSLYVGTSRGTVIRLDATDGHVIWDTRLLANPAFSGITSSPKPAFDRVFIGTFNESGGEGEVVALWEGNGTIAWRHPTASIHLSSPAVVGDTVYVGVMGRYNTTSQVTFDPPYGVLALGAASGMERWFVPTGGSVAASLAVLGPNVIAPAKDGKVYALNRTTGSVSWQVAVDAGISSPTVSGDTVFVGGGAFGGTGRVVALSGSSGSVKWSFAPNGPVQSSLTFASGHLVFSTNTAHGTVYSLNATTGTQEWTFEPTPAEYILGSPVVADAIVYAPSDNGHVYALAQAFGTAPFLDATGVLLAGATIAVAAVAVVVAVFLILRRRSRRVP